MGKKWAIKKIKLFLKIANLAVRQTLNKSARKVKHFMLIAEHYFQ